MKIVIVLGKRLLPNGQLSNEFKLEIAKATLLLQGSNNTLVVVSGGPTRPKYEPEATVAMGKIPYHLHGWVRLETRSHTTRQNLMFTKMLLRDLSVRVSSVVIVSTPNHEERTRYLFNKIWPDMLPHLSFENVGIMDNSRLGQLFHKAFFVMTAIDPNERIFLPLRKLFIRCGFC